MALNRNLLKFLAVPICIAAAFFGYAAITSREALHKAAAKTFNRDGLGTGAYQSIYYTTDVRNPLLTPTAWQGRALYKKWCGACHGKTTGGTTIGPPLVAYDVENHGDDTFYSAIRYGVKQHHWNFGDMPPMPDVTREQARKIIVYVRETQIADDRRHESLNE